MLHRGSPRPALPRSQQAGCRRPEKSQSVTPKHAPDTKNIPAPAQGCAGALRLAAPSEARACGDFPISTTARVQFLEVPGWLVTFEQRNDVVCNDSNVAH